MSKLIIIRGNSGSGKSTLAKSLHDYYKDNSFLINQDIIRKQMLNGDDDKTIDLLIDLLKFGKENYEITILEGILVLRKYQRLFDEIEKIFNSEDIKAYYYDLSFEETLKRHKTRVFKNEFGEEKMRSWFVQRDYLNKFDEVKFDETVDINEAIRSIVRQNI